MLSAAVQATTLLSDNFNGSQVNAAMWSLPTFASGGSYFGVTQQRVAENVPLSALTVKGGTFVLKDDSYNPTDTNGNLSFYGTELVSNQSFAVPTDGGCLDLKVRMKLNSTVGGFVAASFLYNVISPTVHNEDDFELVSNVAASTNQIETNIYANAPFDSGWSVFSNLPRGGKLTDYHTYEEQVYSDHENWLVDGVLVRTENSVLPTGPFQIYLNIWTPDGTWPAAYNSGIQASATAAQNQEYTASVDSVLLTQVPPGPDKTAPAPSPGTWAIKPAAVDNSSITMTATTAIDPSGVEYYFHNQTVSGHDSGWQASPTFTDAGLNASTKYTYQVKTRDLSPARNTGKYSAAAAAVTMPITVTSVTISLSTDSLVQNKRITSSGGITGTGTGALAYYWAVEKPGHAAFQKVGSDHTVKATNGSATIPNFTGLPTSAVGTYSVELVIDSGANKGRVSNVVEYTVIPPAPTPNPSTWAVKPTATAFDTITMTATTASDPAGVEYYFHNLTDPSHDSGWQSSPTYIDTGLTASTKYTYQVRTRDQSPQQNAGKYSSSALTATPARPPVDITNVAISLDNSVVTQGGEGAASGTVTGSGNGIVTYHWTVTQPDGTLLQTGGNLTTSMVSGVAVLANFSLPTYAPGSYTVQAVADNGTGAWNHPSNIPTYTVALASTPGIVITSVPAYGKAGNAVGQVIGIDPADYANYDVVVYIHIQIGNIYADGWWGPKPYWNAPLTAINARGSWSANIDTGGVDADANMVVAYLVPAGTSVPSLDQSGSLPSSLASFPMTQASR